MITATEGGINYNDLNGLIDVNLEVLSQVTTVSVTVKATFDYGTALNPILFQGATNSADWSIFDVTNNTLIGIPAGVTESPAGTYTVDYTFVATNVYTLSVVKDGFIGTVQFTAA